MQLDENYDGIAHALTSLTDRGPEIPGSQSLAHLFLVGSRTQQEQTFISPHPKLQKRIKHLQAMGAYAAAPSQPYARQIKSSQKMIIAAIFVPFIAIIVGLLLFVTAMIFSLAMAGALVFIALAMKLIYLFLK